MQSMSVKNLLQSSGAKGVQGEIVNGKQTAMDSLFSLGKNTDIQETLLNLENGNEENNSAIFSGDFSSLMNQVQKGDQTQKGDLLIKGGKAPNGEKTLQSELALQSNPKIAKASNNLELLLNNLKGQNQIDSEVENIPSQSEGENVEGSNLKKDFFPTHKSSNESPMEFLLKATKDKNNNSAEVVIPETEAKSVKSDFFPTHKNQVLIPNKISTPQSLENMQNQEQTVKVLSGEDFVKNLNAATLTQNKNVNVLGKEKITDLEKKQVGLIPNNIPQIKNYDQGQNILNDGLIKNTRDLAFNKDVKKLKSAGADELHSPDLKIGAELAALKDSSIGMMQLKNNPTQENNNQVETKVLNLSNIDVKNTNEIIKTISDYVEQNNVANKANLDLTVKHDSLGQFKIQVSKAPNQNQMDMQITTSSAEGHKFFVQNEVDLMKNLQQGGINLSDLRIVSSMKESTPFSQSESKQFSSFQNDQNGDSKQFMSFESSDFKEGSQKRRSLWEEYQDRYGA